MSNKATQLVDDLMTYYKMDRNLAAERLALADRNGEFVYDDWDMVFPDGSRIKGDYTPKEGWTLDIANAVIVS